MAIRITKAQLEAKDRKKKNRDGGKAKSGQKGHVYACSSSKEHCWGKFNSKVNAVVHGSKEDAQRCIDNSYKLLTQGEG